MTLTELLPVVAAAGFIVFITTSTVRKTPFSRAGWILPAALSVGFFAFSLVTVINEGLFSFWAEHIDTFWGNQIWFDLLLAVGIGWSWLLPEARRVGLKPWPWLLAVCLTGCIALLAMYARVLYLREQNGDWAATPLGAR